MIVSYFLCFCYVSILSCLNNADVHKSVHKLALPKNKETSMPSSRNKKKLNFSVKHIQNYTKGGFLFQNISTDCFLPSRELIVTAEDF